jgi:glycosyltransferase involved in cell wall biosynthesis
VSARNEAAVPRLSAIVIAKNEAANIGDCLASLAFCDELVVVDGGSQDDTVALARAKGAQVVSAPDWRGYGAQKNLALSQAHGDWVLSIDADERVTPELAREIERAIEEGTVSGYRMPRLSSFCGREIRHSGWYPDYVLRLFRRGKARFSDDLVHERVICEGPIGKLREPLRHKTITSLEDALAKVDRYSTAGAEMLVASGRRVTFMSGIGHGVVAFLRTYFFRAGFLDGAEGFLIAIYNAETTYYRYMKAWLKQRRRQPK